LGRWENENESGRRGGLLGNSKIIVVLVVFMFSFWIMYGVILMTVNEPGSCEAIHEYIGSDDYYSLPSDERQKYINADRNCSNDHMIVR